MKSEKETRLCRYQQCRHPARDIDLKSERFIQDGRRYYHEDCYASYQRDRRKERQIQSDLYYIRQQWPICISRDVSNRVLTECLHALLDAGYASDYLVFAFDYVVSHKLNLNYPKGFKYFVRKREIQTAYSKQHAAKDKTNAQTDIHAAPSFSFQPNPVGFQNILGGKK